MAQSRKRKSLSAKQKARRRKMAKARCQWNKEIVARKVARRILDPDGPYIFGEKVDASLSIHELSEAMRRLSAAGVSVSEQFSIFSRLSAETPKPDIEFPVKLFFE